MEKKLKVAKVLGILEHKIEELLNYGDEEIDNLSPEEIIQLALGLISEPVESKSPIPIGVVDRTQVTFMLDEEVGFSIGDVEDEDQGEIPQDY